MARIAMISEHASPVATLGSTDCGGQNVYVDQVSRGVAHLGYAVDVYTRADHPDRTEPFVWSNGVRIIPVVAGPLSSIPKDAIWSHIDEFIANTERIGGGFGPYDLIHGNFWMSGKVGAHLKQAWGVPLIQIFHALGAVKRFHQGDADPSPAARTEVERAVLNAADRVIAQCPSEADDLESLYDADRSKIRVIPSGVDLARFYPIDRRLARRGLGLAFDDPIMVYVGRVLPRKDIANIFAAMALGQTGGDGRFARARLIVVGGETAGPRLADEPEMRRLITLATDLGIAHRVTFVGRRPSDQLCWYYSAADVFVTTPWYEPYGLTPLEAMACGSPAVCSAVGGITSTVQDGVTGFLVPPRRPDLLAQRLSLVLADDTLRAELGRSARRRVVGNFTWSTVARRTADLYGEIINARFFQTA